MGLLTTTLPQGFDRGDGHGEDFIAFLHEIR